MERSGIGERIARGAAWVLVLAVVGGILFFSSQTADASTQSSNTVTAVFYRAIHGETAGIDPLAFDLLDALIRACAHIFEYMVLSAAVGVLMSAYRVRGQVRAFYMTVSGFALSLVDEALQTFVPGRYGDLSDVVADTFGAGCVALLLYLLWRRGERKKATAAAEHPEDSGLTPPARRRFMRITLDDIGAAAALDRILTAAGAEGGGRIVVTPNADHIVRLEKDEEFLVVYREAYLTLPDGMPLLWIAASMGWALRERVPGADLWEPVCARAAAEGRSVFFLGGLDDVARRAAERMKEKYPELIVAGTYSPAAEYERDEEETRRILRAVNAASPDILFFCLGAPRSEKFLYQHREELRYKVGLPFGTAIDYAAGEQRRAPEWMRRVGLEWLYRFLQEPGRLFYRYFIEDMRIFLLALKYRVSLQSGEASEDAVGEDARTKKAAGMVSAQASEDMSEREDEG